MKRALDAASNDALQNTNALVAANVAALLTLLPIAAHQLGFLSHLPDPPSVVFGSDKITESATSHPLGIPDSLLGLGSYGVSLSLVLLARRHRAARRLLALKLLADGGVASFNVVRQVVKFRKLCSWCMGTAAMTTWMLFEGRDLLAEQIEELRGSSA